MWKMNIFSLLAQTLEFRDSLFVNFKYRWLKVFLDNLTKNDGTAYHTHWEKDKSEIALFKLSLKSQSYWPLVHIVETFFLIAIK